MVYYTSHLSEVGGSCVETARDTESATGDFLALAMFLTTFTAGNASTRVHEVQGNQISTVATATGTMTTVVADGEVTKVFEDIVADTITIVDADGTTTATSRSEIYAAVAGIEKQEVPHSSLGRYATTQNQNQQICRILANVAGGLHGYAWRAALQLVSIHPVLKVVIILGERGFMWWVKSNCRFAQ